jgi:hypothetical protein
MRFHRTTLGVFLISGMLLLAPSLVFAQVAGTASTQQLAAEYQRLRVDLDRVNAEVAALKRAERGVRNDYRLRDKMAEAEALARKVTAAESRLRTARGPLPADSHGGTVEAPVAMPQDGAVELEAKADLLTDQARRFQAEADTLTRTAQQIRARQALRRRAGAWDRDPLAGFEASKRSMGVPASRSVVAASDNGKGATSGPTQGVSGTTKMAGGTGSTASERSPAPNTDMAGSGTAAGATPTADTAKAAVPVLALTPTASVPSTPSTESVPATTSVMAAPPARTTLTASGLSDSASKSVVQQRPLLDPATLATIRSSLTQTGSLSDPDAVEAAASALRKHAQALEERARRLRVRSVQQ